ncbi:2-oxoglutarate synthase subunit KorA [uncultured archaeon]|nr:2-oxoglutarate synthase subunit KorA [uncultured archaeon]
MRWNVLFGGPAGTGPNVLTNILGQALVEHGNHVFYSRDYQSLIRGGHNFNVLTFSNEPVWSNDSEYDVIVALDDNTEKLHRKNLKKSGIILKGEHTNMYFAGRLFKLFCLDFKLLEAQLKKLEKRFDENLREAKKGYDEEKKSVCQVKGQKPDHYFINGNQGISRGAIKSGIGVYYAYPMTPATPILNELAAEQVKNNFSVIELENEIAVVMAGIGSSATGKKVMIGTSGGGYDLMTEGISMAGITELPIVAYLSQRPGPATGVATYTAQGDLRLALNSSHGEFPRIVLAAGDPKEAEELTNQCFYFSQKFKVPAIILGDKHLAESFYTIHEKVEVIPVPSTVRLGRFNSYEKDSQGCATENPEIIKKNIEARLKKTKEIEKESKKFQKYKVYGDKNAKKVIIGWGSTKGAVLDAIKEMKNVKFLQILYMEPFPIEIKKELDKKKVILVENNSTAQLAGLIAEKTGIFVENKILRYDGRPFLADELKKEIEKELK